LQKDVVSNFVPIITRTTIMMKKWANSINLVKILSPYSKI
jgi:hypothetical protein